MVLNFCPCLDESSWGHENDLKNGVELQHQICPTANRLGPDAGHLSLQHALQKSHVSMHVMFLVQFLSTLSPIH